MTAAWLFSRLSCGKIAQWTHSRLLEPRVEKYIRLFPPAFLTILAFFALAAIGREAGPLLGGYVSSFLEGKAADSLGLAFLYQFGKSFFWWFGLHGDMFMSELINKVYLPAQFANQAGDGAHIFTSVFFNAGAVHLWGLAIAILVFSRLERRRSTVKFCLPTLLFNLQEVIVFGLPVMFNPILLAPYFLAPLANVFVGWLAISSGIVPVFKFSIPWTTPPILGGILSTGSLMGGVLQAVWLVMDIFIYAPFVIVSNMVRSDGETEKEDDA